MSRDYKKVFRYNTINHNAKGGTELTIDGLLDNVDNDLFKDVDILVSSIPNGFSKGDKTVILWIHDLPIDFQSINKYKDDIDIYVFVSNWQKELFIRTFGLDWDKCKVIKNPIHPIDVDLNKKWESTEKIKIVYSSTPHRGLNILQSVFNEIHKVFKNTELHVFSNFDLYDQPFRNRPFENLFKVLKEQDGVVYRGAVKHDELINELKDAHIWVLPSIHEETYCIALAEAMSAGCICVHSNLGALPETSRGVTISYDFFDDLNKHANMFYKKLGSVIETINSDINQIKNLSSINKILIDTFGNWEIGKRQWIDILNEIKA